MGNKLNIKEKNKNTYTKEMIIKNIAKISGRNISIVRSVYNTLEETMMILLSSANSNTDVSLRLFEGITIDSIYIPEKNKKNNLTGNIITTTSKIKPKANITRNYCNKLTNYNK